MSNFQSPNDTPFQIKTEGETIKISFSPGLPVSGQGLVEWNIPTPAQGCSSDSKGAYCGMVVLLSTNPLQPENAPKNGTFYTPDPTADVDIHAGDQINDALVVGAFYEGELINQGGEATTSFHISDLKPNTPYYVAGYAVDCQARYHTDGVRAYSDQYAGMEPDGLPSSQIVVLSDNEGALPTDGTGLTPGFIYEFEMDIDPTFPSGEERQTVKVSVDGSDVSTYGDLLTEINKAIALANNPLQSPVQPNADRYYWDVSSETLTQWDGSVHQPLPGAIIEETDPSPSILSIGTYWFNGTNLTVWNGASWLPTNLISHNEDPTNLTKSDDFWFNGTDVFKRCGDTWCQNILHNQENDPTIIPHPTECGVFWFDEINTTLNEWDVELQQWIEKFAVSWDTAPNAMVNGSYWVDADNKLYVRSAGSWVEIIPRDSLLPITTPQVSVLEAEPEAPLFNNLYWYNPATEILQQYNVGTTSWDTLSVLVWPDDPTNVDTCDLWWNTTNDELRRWDIVHSEWDLVTQFSISETNPLTPPTLTVGELWYVPSTEKLFIWDGINWIETSYINFATDPTMPALDDIWQDISNNVWYRWDGAAWILIDPTDSVINPTALPNGTLWFDSANTILYERQGVSWVVVPFSTLPFTPKKGERWFDTTSNELKEWNGSAWVSATPLATASLNDNGNLQLQTTFTGSDACIMILVPDGVHAGVNPNIIATGTAGHDFFNYGIYNNIPVTETTVDPNDFLFESLPNAYITKQEYGETGLNPVPSYDAVGIGDDGSPDERRELTNSIMAQLGHPTVTVELTPYQLDKAIELALRSIRKRTSVAYKRGFFFLDIKPRVQHYRLTDHVVGFNKIVTVMSAHRMTSAFLSSAHGAGVYGQVVLQHLYNMGTFDLLSFHLVSQYVEQMEHLFATRLTYHWHESDRTLSFYQSFSLNERILLDVMVERSEQELFKDRWTRDWIERYALAESMRILSQVRGKFASLPGAGGGISLNAAELIAQHDMLKDQLYQQIDDYIVNDVEDVGMMSSFVIG